MAKNKKYYKKWGLFLLLFALSIAGMKLAYLVQDKLLVSAIVHDLSRRSSSQDMDRLFPDERDQYASCDDAMRSVLLRLLAVFDYICQENRLTYWIDGGTLLGAVRHQGFIPWDDDVDVCMPEADYERFLVLAPSYLGKDMLLLDGARSPYLNKGIAKLYDTKSSSRFSRSEWNGCLPSGLFVDIFSMESHSQKIEDIKQLSKQAQNKTKPTYSLLRRIKNSCKEWVGLPQNADKRLRETLCDQGEYLYLRCRWFCYFYRRSQVYPLQKLPFESLSLPAPGDAHGYLTCLYGNYRKPPPESERIPHLLDVKTAQPDTYFYR